MDYHFLDDADGVHRGVFKFDKEYARQYLYLTIFFKQPYQDLGRSYVIPIQDEKIIWTMPLWDSTKNFAVNANEDVLPLPNALTEEMKQYIERYLKLIVFT